MKLSKSYIPYLILSLIFLGLSFLFSSNSYKKKYHKKKLNELQEYFFDSEDQFSKIATQLFEQEEISFQDLTQFSNEDYTILYYEENDLIYWSSNDFVPETQIVRKLRATANNSNKGDFRPIDEKMYYIQSFSDEDIKKLFFIQQLNGNKNLLADSFFGETPIITLNSTEIGDHALVLKNRNGQDIKTVSIINPDKSNKFLEISWFLFILFMGIFIYMLFSKLSKNHLVISNVFLLLGGFLILKEIVKKDPFQVLNDIEIFQPNLFANPNIGESLGLIIINYLILHIAMYYWYLTRAKFTIIRKTPKFIQVIFTSAFISIAFWLLCYTCRSLIRDSFSDISYNPFSDWYTLTVFILLFFAVLFKFLFDLRMLKFIRNRFNLSEISSIGVLVILFSGLILSNNFEFKEVFFLVIWHIVSLVVMYLLLENPEQKIKQLSGVVLQFTLFAFFCAQVVKYYSFEKKRWDIKQTALKLSYEEDSESMFEIASLTESITNDPIIQSQINSPFLTEPTLINRIETQYIQDELSKYKIDYTFSELSDTNQTIVPIVSKTDFGKFDYTATIPFAAPTNKLITIRFRKPKINLNDNYYASLNNSTTPPSILTGQFSYAIFKNNELVYLEGNIEEPNWEKVGSLSPGQDLLQSSGLDSKMYYQKDENTTILIRIQDVVRNNELLFLFTNFFGFLFFGFLLYILIISGFKISRFQFFKNSLANQIQYLVIFFLYLAGFIVTYSSFQVSKRQLLSVQKAIYERIPQKLLTDYKTKTEPEDRNLSSFREELEINVPGSPYDIHLYDSNGDLVYTNQSFLFENNLWPERINPNVLQTFNHEAVQSITEIDKIENHRYYGFYRAIRFNGLEVDGVLFVPGLDIIKAVNNQRNSVVSSQFNAFSVVLFILTFISLIISQSLTNILFRLRRRFSQVELGDNSKLIAWENDDEIGELVHEYNEMVKKLDNNAVLLARSERESAWRDLAKQIAHEIKNPLTPMKLSIQHLKRRVGESEETEMDAAILNTLNSLEQQTNHLSKIADNFSSIAKMDLPNFQSLDIVEEIEQAIAIYDNNEHYDILFNNLLPDDVSSTLTADKTMISRVLNNLLKNATQALISDRKGEIRLSLDGDEEQFILLVMDNGKGIDAKNRAKIFTPNFTTKSSGTGIGLMMTKKIVELHKGTISFESVKGSGTVFTIILPRTEVEV